MSWRQNRDTKWQVGSLKAGLTAGPSAQGASLELGSLGGDRRSLLADNPLPALVSPPDPLHGTLQMPGQTFSHHLKESQIQ